MKFGPRLAHQLIHTGTPGDVAFYEAQCRDAASVLEFGCGTGRLLEAFVKSPGHVVGIEQEAEACRFARRRLDGAAMVVRGDVARMDLGATFDRVVLAYNVLFALPSREEQVLTLRNAARHLAPGGAILLDTYAVWEDELADVLEPDLEPETLVRIDAYGAAIDVDHWQEAGPDDSSVTMVYRFRTADEEYLLRLPHQIVPVEHFGGLCADAGLTRTASWGDFVAAEPGRDHAQIAWRLEPALVEEPHGDHDSLGQR